MKNMFSRYLLAGCALYLFGCQLTSKSPAEGWTVGQQPYVERYCVDNQQCADINILLPEFKGDQSATLGLFNSQIQHHLISVLQGPIDLPIELAVDSIAEAFFQKFKDYKTMTPVKTENWALKLICSVPVLTPQITTIEAQQLMKVMDNPKIETFHIISYDFRTEKYLTISDIVPDTNALRPILESAFAQARELKSSAEINKVISPAFDRLPMPRYAAVYTDGIRIVYNHIEYSAEPVPLTDFKLEWSQLGDLADRSEWFK